MAKEKRLWVHLWIARDNGEVEQFMRMLPLEDAKSAEPFNGLNLVDAEKKARKLGATNPVRQPLLLALDEVNKRIASRVSRAERGVLRGEGLADHTAENMTVVVRVDKEA